MEPRDLERRAEIARRLKAARWLAGGTRPNSKGRVGHEVVALTAQELATRPGMVENGITATLIGAIERMERHTPPMELEQIAQALGMSRDYFRTEGASALSDDQLRHAAELLGPQLLAAAEALARARAEEPEDTDAPDRPAAAPGGAAA